MTADALRVFPLSGVLGGAGERDVMSEPGTHSPFTASHKFGSFRGFICRAFDTDGPAD
jgi:hypothetical protein